MLYYLLALAAGAAGVIQSGLNRQMAEKTGLALALHIGNLVVLIGGIVILSIVPLVSRGEFAQMTQFKFRFGTELWDWWYLVPGVMGLFFIVTAPVAISKIGAQKVFIGIICAQVLGGLLWDRFVEGTPVDGWRLAACALTTAGAGALLMSKS